MRPISIENFIQKLQLFAPKAAPIAPQPKLPPIQDLCMAQTSRKNQLALPASSSSPLVIRYQNSQNAALGKQPSPMKVEEREQTARR